MLEFNQNVHLVEHVMKSIKDDLAYPTNLIIRCNRTMRTIVKGVTDREQDKLWKPLFLTLESNQNVYLFIHVMISTKDYIAYPTNFAITCNRIMCTIVRSGYRSGP